MNTSYDPYQTIVELAKVDCTFCSNQFWLFFNRAEQLESEMCDLCEEKLKDILENRITGYNEE